MKKSKTIAALEEILASSYALMLKTQNYHWNVEGKNFKSMHELFGEQYEEIFAAIDEIAERIRSLGSKVEASFEGFLKLAENSSDKKSKVKSGNKDFLAEKMISDLLNDNESLARILRQAVKIAQSEGDEASADLLIERVAIHEKAAWMLKSSIG